MAGTRKLTLGFNERSKEWDLRDDVSDRVLKSFGTKRQALRAGVLNKSRGAKPASIKIQKQNGRIQEERTYPPSSDPHRRKG